jgi:hypothetical protein
LRSFSLVELIMPDEQQEEGKELELHIGEGDSVPPTDPKAQQLRSWANIIATTTALLTAVVAIVKPQDQTVSRNTYEQLKTSIEQTNESVKQNHDDMVALHNYLQGYFAEKTTLVLPPLSSALPAPSASSVAPPATTSSRKYATAPTATASITFAIPTGATALAYVPAAPAAAPAFPLPTVSSATPPPALPAFDSVAGKK